MSRRVLLSSVREVFMTDTQVASTLGVQLERMSNAEVPSTFHDRIVQRSNRRVIPVLRPETMHVNRIPITEVHVDEQSLIDRAAVFRCAEALERHADARWCKLRAIPSFAAKRSLRAGSVAARVLRAAGSWSDRQGQVSGVSRWLRTYGVSEDLAPTFLDEAEHALATWVEAWNKQRGFRPWMTVKEFALRYAVPEPIVLNWCARGRLPAEKQGATRWRIDMTEIPEPVEL